MMSAFVVSERTMQRCVAALHLDSNESCEDADQLGRDLYALNEQAVNYRYKDSAHIAQANGDYSEWRWRVTCPLTGGHGVPLNRKTACEYLKALHCLKYQMSEGEEVPAHYLYQRIEKRIRVIESSLCRSLPEYEAAKWDDEG